MDKAIWNQVRLELTREGFSETQLKNNKSLLIEYVKDIDDRQASDSFNRSDGIKHTAKEQDTEGTDRHPLDGESITSRRPPKGISLDRSSSTTLKLMVNPSPRSETRDRTARLGLI